MRGLKSAAPFSAVVLAVAGAFAGCGDAGGNDPTNPNSVGGVAYTVSPSTLLLAPGQSGTVVVTVTRSPDFKGELTLTVGGLFNDVTGTLNPAVLPEGTTSTTLTITPGTGGGNFGTMTLTIDPSLGGKGVNVNGTPPTLSVTVSIRPTVVINKAGSGSGTITSNPAGINCGTVCTATFPFTQITLTATPATGSAFASWSGLCFGTTPSCSFTPRVNASSNFNFGTVTFTSTTQAMMLGVPFSPLEFRR